jgi:hypothetical protein
MSELERVPPEEAGQIENIVNLTLEQMKRRYAGQGSMRRGVHPKDHGCVSATFKVEDDLADDLRVGVFATPGREYAAMIRFSNATVVIGSDSTVLNGTTTHGSRGMAIKLPGVDGTPLMEDDSAREQDFLMVNHPVFPIATVEDYEALSRILRDNNDDPTSFFTERIRRNSTGGPDVTDPVTLRAFHTAQVLGRIQSPTFPPAYQQPPCCPLDNRYFSGSPFLFGEGKAMKYSAKPVTPHTGEPECGDANYLRASLKKQLGDDGAQPVVFEFLVQVRDGAEVGKTISNDIEDASFEWDEAKFPYRKVATITIPPQDIDDADRVATCERLVFTPWHGVAEHRPLGGINRLRLGVYKASAKARLGA